MGIDKALYRGWKGELSSPWLGCMALVRVAFRQVFRKVVFWFGVALGMLSFLTYFVLIFIATQVPGAGERILDVLNFSAVPKEGVENGYLMFMETQGVIVILVLALIGSLLVGADFRQGAIAFYLARRIDRRHYIVGKILAVGAVIAMLTVLPALVLYVEYGGFTSSFRYWVDNWKIPVSILGYGVLISLVLSIWLVSLSAYLQRMAPIAIAWTSGFLLLRATADLLRSVTKEKAFYLLDPWRVLRYVARHYLGFFPRSDDAEYAPYAALILLAITAVALAALIHRVRAVEVVS